MPQAAPNNSAVILTALDLETRAVLRHVPEWSEETVEGTVFYCGRFADWRVSVAEVGAGNPSAAAIAERAIRHFNPRVALFVGVAGGVKDVALGDVVVATKVYGYESGKEDAGNFNPRAEVFRSAHEIEQRGRALCKRDNWRTRLDPSIQHGAPNIFVAPIAAGEKVVASSRKATARLLRKLYSDAVAVEMEGRGFLEGVHLNADVRGGVIRGISDLLDGKTKADKAGSQKRAADAASAAVFEILSGLDGGRASVAARTAENVAKPIATPVRHDARIVLGTGKPYETVEPSGVNRSRTVRVKIQNETDIEISNGTLQLLNLDPPNKDHKDFLIEDGITIGPRGHTFVRIAAYNEGTSQARVGIWIQLLLPPPPGGFFGPFPGHLPVTPHTFYLRFSCLEGGCFDEVYCRIFVDQNHILHLENWEDSAKFFGAPAAEQEISLFEAATRAYEKTKEKPISIVIEELANSSDDILIRLCNELVRPQNGKAPLVKLRGNKPPSREKEEIYIDPLSRYDFVVEGNTIVLQERNGGMRYEGLSVNAAELDTAIRELAIREV